MRKATRDRILDSFAGTDNADLAQYITWLRDTMTDCATNMQRLVLILFLLIAAFEIVVESPSATIGVGSFQISKGSIVLLFIPAVAAYLQLQVVLDAKRFQSLTAVLHTTFAFWSLPGLRNDADFFIRPIMPVYWYVAGLTEKAVNRPPIRKFEQIASGAFTISILLGMLAFQAQAYYILFSERRDNIALCAICLLASTFFLSLSYCSYFTREHRGSLRGTEYYDKIVEQRLSPRNSGGAAFDADPGAIQEKKG